MNNGFCPVCGGSLEVISYGGYVCCDTCNYYKKFNEEKEKAFRRAEKQNKIKKGN